jgi:hypothetical protein
MHAPDKEEKSSSMGFIYTVYLCTGRENIHYLELLYRLSMD